jgi:hypothetical protein
MNIAVLCKVSLSKKIRALMKDGELLLNVSIVNGTGEGKLVLTSDEIKDGILEVGETSIMITPFGEEDVAVDYEDRGVAEIFSSIPSKGKQNKMLKKIAVVDVPETEDIKDMTKEKVEVPKAFKETKNPAYKNYVMNFESLMVAVNKAKNKKSSIDVDLGNIKNDKERREKAVLLEQKEKEEAIDIPVFIVNDKCAAIAINDLNIVLPLNVPYDLSRISAKRIASSRDLKQFLDNGYIKFVSPNEKFNYIKVAAQEIPTLDVFNSAEEAEEAIEEEYMEEKQSHGIKGHASGIKRPKPSVMIDNESAYDITEENMDEPTEGEMMITNLTQDLPITKNTKKFSNTTKTTKMSNNREGVVKRKEY